MKKYAKKIALLALVAVGMLSISSCEKEENNSNRLTLGEIGSVWQCSTEHYTITWTLLNDNTIYSEVEQDSGYYTGFGNNMWYNYFIADKGDDVNGATYNFPVIAFTKRWDTTDTLYLGDAYCYKLDLSDNNFTIKYAGAMSCDVNEYYVDCHSFKKIK